MKSVKWVLVVVGVLLVAVCAAMSIHALSEARQKAAE